MRDVVSKLIEKLIKSSSYKFNWKSYEVYLKKYIYVSSLLSRYMSIAYSILLDFALLKKINTYWFPFALILAGHLFMINGPKNWRYTQLSSILFRILYHVSLFTESSIKIYQIYVE